MQDHGFYSTGETAWTEMRRKRRDKKKAGKRKLGAVKNGKEERLKGTGSD